MLRRFGRLVGAGGLAWEMCGPTKVVRCYKALERGQEISAEADEALALPALKRVIRDETLSQSAKALLPPHKCGRLYQRPGPDTSS